MIRAALLNMVESFRPGEGGTVLGDPPPDPLPLALMLKDAAALCWDAWTAYAFRRDPLARSVSPSERLKQGRAASACGAQWAEALAGAYGTRDPRALIGALHITLRLCGGETGGPVPIFAQFTPPAEITLFSRYSRRAREAVDALAGKLDFSVPVEETLLAHELFHFIEETKVFSTQGTGNPLRVGKPLRGCLSEIAGMAFAQTLLGLPYSPYMLDILLLYTLDGGAAWDLYRNLMDQTHKEGY